MSGGGEAVPLRQHMHSENKIVSLCVELEWNTHIYIYSCCHREKCLFFMVTKKNKPWVFVFQNMLKPQGHVILQSLNLIHDHENMRFNNLLKKLST